MKMSMMLMMIQQTSEEKKNHSGLCSISKVCITAGRSMDGQRLPAEVNKAGRATAMDPKCAAVRGD